MQLFVYIKRIWLKKGVNNCNFSLSSDVQWQHLSSCHLLRVCQCESWTVFSAVDYTALSDQTVWRAAGSIVLAQQAAKLCCLAGESGGFIAALTGEVGLLILHQLHTEANWRQQTRKRRTFHNTYICQTSTLTSSGAVSSAIECSDPPTPTPNWTLVPVRLALNAAAY